MKKILDVSINKIYIMLVILISLLMLGGYFSYAMFTVTKEKSNAISIVTGNLIYDLKVDGEDIESLTVPAGTTKVFTVTLSNPNNRIARFNFYYLGSLPDGVTTGYSLLNNGMVTPESTGINLEKTETSGSSNTYRIVVVNDSDSEVTINLGVSVGLDYNDLTLPENGHLFEPVKKGPVGDVVITNPGENGSTYDDEEDTFLTGEEPNNYIWYSGKLWRAVSVNNEENTVKLVTEWSQSATPYNNTDTSSFKGSHMEMWLNDTTVDGFLGNLRDYENFIKLDSKWNATMMTDTSKPPSTTIVEDPVGLLNLYEYQVSYNGTTYSNGYLNNGNWWWLITPYSSSEVYKIRHSGLVEHFNAYNAPGIRPAINLKREIEVVEGTGTASDPYRLEGDNDKDLSGVKLNTRYSGEYIKFGSGENNLYRIVSKENGIGTKITSVNPLKDNGSFKTTYFGNTEIFSSGNTIGKFLNGDYLTNYLTEEDRNMVEETSTWYLGGIEPGENYRLTKYTNTNMNNYATSTKAKVGLLRVGELMAGQYERFTFKDDTYTDLNNSYWLLTSQPSIRFVWNINYYSDLNYSLANNDREISIKPTLNLEKNVTIVSGTGTKEDPFVLEAEKDEGRIRIVNSNGVFIDYLKYEDGTYVKDTDTFKIVSDVNNNYVVETASGLTDNNTNIQLYTFNNSNAQKWKFNNSTTKNYYNFVLASNTNKAIDIYSGSTADGTNIQLYDLNTSNAQKWSFVESGEENVYYIRSNIGTCMDIKNGEIKNGANIQSYTCNKSSAQKWKIEKVD